MIEFQCLIHKPTGHVLSYDTWLSAYKNDQLLTFCGFDTFAKDSPNIEPVKRYHYTNAKELLFSNDFEIVYKPQISYHHLRKLYESLRFGTSKYDEVELKNLISRQIKEFDYLRARYNIR